MEQEKKIKEDVPRMDKYSFQSEGVAKTVNEYMKRNSKTLPPEVYRCLAKLDECIVDLGNPDSIKKYLRIALDFEASFAIPTNSSDSPFSFQIYYQQSQVTRINSFLAWRCFLLQRLLAFHLLYAFNLFCLRKVDAAKNSLTSAFQVLQHLSNLLSSSPSSLPDFSPEFLTKIKIFLKIFLFILSDDSFLSNSENISKLISDPKYSKYYIELASQYKAGLHFLSQFSFSKSQLFQVILHSFSSFFVMQVFTISKKKISFSLIFSLRICKS